MLTDIIKIRDNLICLTSTKLDKETLIIVLINFYNGMEYNVRYYLIDMFKLYNHKFLSEMKLHLYNNNIAFGFSFCYNSKCDGDEDEHYSSIIFFSYPNSTDFNLDIISYLNKMDNNNIIINLFDYVNIDNNIFGFIIDGIKIYSIDNCGINYVSNKTNKEINENYYLLKEENLQLNFSKNKYQIQTCSIIFIPIITEPDFNEYNKYPNFILNESDANEQKNFTKTLYEGKYGNFNISISQELQTNCEEEENNNCNLCLQRNKSHCLICKYNYNFTHNVKICQDYYYDIEDIIKGKCPDIILNNEQLKKIYWYIKDEILNDDYNGENIIIPTSNIYFQISVLEDQKYSSLHLSSIDLLECEKILKDNNNIKYDDSLIIFKIDMKNKNLSTTHVKYEIYNPYILKLLGLSCCNKSNIIMDIPVDLDSEKISVYDSLSQYGYNLFNPNDSFYNDICTIYGTEKGIDIILSDRKNEIFMKNGNKILCQNNCNINKYNLTGKKAVCECSAQMDIDEPDLANIIKSFNQKDLEDSLLISLKNSNYLILKCYKLVFNVNNIWKNNGMIIMTIILILSIFLFIIHYIKEQKKIDYYIKTILKIKFFSQSLENKKLQKIKKSKIEKFKSLNNKKNTLFI